MSGEAPDVVLDDDPTGVQAVRDVPVLLSFDVAELRALAARRPRAVHLMTNIRSLSPDAAGRLTYAAAAAARTALPGARVVLRGDSTLRGHVLEEYRAVRQAAFPGLAPVLLLVPALPDAGRITRGGVQWLVDDHGARPLHETEYAGDGCFAYASARLLEWAEERTGGELAAPDGSEVGLGELRAGGASAVAAALARASAAGRPAACAPDAETVEDLEIIAAGLRQAEVAGVPVLVRCAPTFAGVLSDTLADRFIDLPKPDSEGVLVVCGSYVAGTTRQLARLRDRLGVDAVVADVHALAGAEPGPEIRRLAGLAAARLRAHGVALLTTPRERPADLMGLDAGERVARGLAAAVAAVKPLPGVVIAKGGITSHVVFEHGLGAHAAQVAGPVLAGVALWQARARGQQVQYLVFPGNVGGPDHLADLVELVLERSGQRAREHV